MSSEQVAQVLRSAGTNVKLLVARQKPTMDAALADQLQSDQGLTFSSLVSFFKKLFKICLKNSKLKYSFFCRVQWKQTLI